MNLLDFFKNVGGKKFWLSILSFYLLLGGLLTALILVQKKQLIEKRAAGENSSLTLPSSLTVNPGEEFSVPIGINTDGADISGVDVVLDFSNDRNKISLVDIQPNAQTTTNLKTFAPVNTNGSFDTTIVVNRANSTGILEFGAVTFDWTAEDITNPFNGTLSSSNPFATLTFLAVSGGQATVSVVHTVGQTTDSNLVDYQTATDILAHVSSLTVNILGPVTTTPAISPTPTTSPTPTIILTPTPTPTQMPGTAKLTFMTKFQGISSNQASGKTVRVILEQGGEEKYRFDSVSIIHLQNGVYSGTLHNINPDSYDVLIKGWAHLQRKFLDISLIEGENNQDWSEVTFLAGDTNEDDKVNSLDFAILVRDYIPHTPPDSPADFDLNGQVNSLDFLFIVENYYQEGEK